MTPELIIMLTNNDITVSNAAEIFESCKDLPVKKWGFKDVGLPKEEMIALAKAMKEAGKETYIEVVTYTEEGCLEGAKLAYECGFDYLTGTLPFDSVYKYAKSHNLKYSPFCGAVGGSPVVLMGAAQSVIESAKECIAKGAIGIDLTSYRYEDGDPVEITKAIVDAVGADKVCIAGSIGNTERMDAMKEVGVAAYTMGSALFHANFVKDGSFRENLEFVLEYLKKYKSEEEKKMSLEKFTHVFPAMVTPMNEDGSFHYDVAKKHLDWMYDNGIGGVGILMAAGEYQSISIEEHKEYCDIMVPYAKEKGMSVIIGASRERVEDVVQIMNHAYHVGADAAMVLPAFYYNQSQEEIIDHYTYINNHSELDIMVYNNPNVTSGITRETMKELFKLPHVKIVKDASMVIDIMTDYILEAEQAEDDKAVLCGCDYLLYSAYATGAIGWISMTANILPKLSADFHRAMVVEKDYKKGLEIYKQLYPVVNMTERYSAPTQAVKHILSEVYGFEEGICRRPRRKISDADKKLVVEWSEIKRLAKTNKR